MKEDAVLVLEGFLGLRLPEDYRRYLLNTNGGKPEKNLFPIPGQGDDAVNRFFSLISKNKEETIPYQLNNYKNRMPSEMLPIGNDAGGNVITLSMKGKNRGSIFFWDHDKESDEEPQPYYENLTLIADSFSLFLENLK